MSDFTVVAAQLPPVRLGSGHFLLAGLHAWLKCLKRPARDRRAEDQLQADLGINCVPGVEQKGDAPQAAGRGGALEIPCNNQWYKVTFGPVTPLRSAPPGFGTDGAWATKACDKLRPVGVRDGETSGLEAEDLKKPDIAYDWVRDGDPDLFYRMQRWAGTPDAIRGMGGVTGPPEGAEDAAAEYARDTGPGGGDAVVTCKPVGEQRCTLQRRKGGGSWRVNEAYRAKTDGWIIEPSVIRVQGEGTGTWYHGPDVALCVSAQFKCKPAYRVWKEGSVSDDEVVWDFCSVSNGPSGGAGIWDRRTHTSPASSTQTTCSTCDCAACTATPASLGAALWTHHTRIARHAASLDPFWGMALLYDAMIDQRADRSVATVRADAEQPPG